MSEPIQPPWWQAPRPGRRRQPLSRAAIVEAALRVLDAEGADALTVRRVAEELGTGSATLYWHIGSKDELGELVYDHVMGEVELPEPDPSRWDDQVKDMARQVYRVLLAHNDVVRFSIGRVPAGPNMLRVMEWSLAVMRGAGMPERAAAYAGDILGRYLDASVLEATAQAGPPPEAVGEYFRTLPADEFPHIVELTKAMVGGDNDERFEFGLEVLVRGLAAQLGGATSSSTSARPRSRTRPRRPRSRG